jgi:plasmid stabilization system protein ParE
MLLVWDDLAIAELKEAVDWYSHTAPEQIDRLLDEVLHAEQLIGELPKAWHPIETGYRSFRLNHFPYSLIDLDDPSLAVIAFIHQHRRPGYWLDRNS